MHHFVREPALSIVDAAIEIGLSSHPPTIANTGITELKATVPDPDPATGVVTAVEHLLQREAGETERDFLAQALAIARQLGAKAVRFAGTMAVPQPQQEEGR